MLGRKMTDSFKIGNKSSDLPKLGQKLRLSQVIPKDGITHGFQDNQIPKQGTLEKYHKKK